MEYPLACPLKAKSAGFCRKQSWGLVTGFLQRKQQSFDFSVSALGRALPGTVKPTILQSHEFSHFVAKLLVAQAQCGLYL